MLNRPSVAGAVLQSPPSLINSVSQSSFKSKYLPNTLNRKPEELGSWDFEIMFIPHCFTCQVSHVTCQVSGVTCHLPRVIYFLCLIFYKKINSLKKIGQSGGASGWRICYQQGLPWNYLFYLHIIIIILHIGKQKIHHVTPHCPQNVFINGSTDGPGLEHWKPL